MKSPTPKIQFQIEESYIKIEPLVAPEQNSVPPLRSAALKLEGQAVPKSGQSLTPEVQDATSVAASLNAWDGDPVSSPAPALPSADTFFEVDMDVATVFSVEQPLFPAFDIYRDTYPCFSDESYSKLPRKGPLRSLFYTTLVYPPTRPGAVQPPVQPLREIPPVPCSLDVSILSPLPPTGGDGMLPDMSP